MCLSNQPTFFWAKWRCIATSPPRCQRWHSTILQLSPRSGPPHPSSQPTGSRLGFSWPFWKSSKNPRKMEVKSFLQTQTLTKSQLSRLGLMNRIKEAFIDLNTSSPHQRQLVGNWKQKAQNQNHIKITCNVSRFLSLVMHRFGTQQHPGCLFTIQSRMCVSHISVFSFKRLPKTSTNQSAVFSYHPSLIHPNLFVPSFLQHLPQFWPPFSAPQNYQTTKPIHLCGFTNQPGQEGWWPESWKWRPEGSGGPSTPWNL